MSSPQDSTPLVRREMRARGEATRPQLARACGLSLVTVNRVVKNLCETGEIEPVGEVSSGGGRPVQLYRLRRTASWAALLRLSAADGVLLANLELLDPLGAAVKRSEARFAHLEEWTLDTWLDEQFRSRRRLQGITLEATTLPLPPGLCRHLAERYKCTCRRVSASDALAELREGTLTLCLAPGHAPLGTLRRGNSLQACGALGQLPLPAEWKTLDYEDHTLVEEMVARLLHIISCTLAPARFMLYGTFWTERLLRRIRFNFSTKMRHSPLPAVSFRRLTDEAVANGLRRLALEESAGG